MRAQPGMRRSLERGAQVEAADCRCHGLGRDHVGRLPNLQHSTQRTHAIDVALAPRRPRRRLLLYWLRLLLRLRCLGWRLLLLQLLRRLLWRQLAERRLRDACKQQCQAAALH